MFRKLFKKKNSLVILHQEEGISGNDAREVAERMKSTMECKIILIPYGFSLENIHSKWALIENGKTRYGFSKELVEGLKAQLGTDVILVRHGLNISIYEEE